MYKHFDSAPPYLTVYFKDTSHYYPFYGRRPYLKTGLGVGIVRATEKMKIVPTEYSLEIFQRSNQDTSLTHKPSVFEGTWVQSGDLLTDCASSIGGELALGQNLLIAYMPWEGYNFEDAILISERLVRDDLYTSVHIERYDIETSETKLGFEQITRDIPDISEKEIDHLDSFGIVKMGAWVEEGDILVGKVTPINKKAISPYQKLLYTILEKQIRPIRDSSLRAPKGIKAKVIDIKYFLRLNSGLIKPSITETKLNKKKKTSLTNKQTVAPPLRALTIDPKGNALKVHKATEGLETTSTTSKDSKQSRTLNIRKKVASTKGNKKQIKSATSFFLKRKLDNSNFLKKINKLFFKKMSKTEKFNFLRFYLFKHLEFINKLPLNFGNESLQPKVTPSEAKVQRKTATQFGTDITSVFKAKANLKRNINTNEQLLLKKVISLQNLLKLSNQQNQKNLGLRLLTSQLSTPNTLGVRGRVDTRLGKPKGKMEGVGKTTEGAFDKQMRNIRLEGKAKKGAFQMQSMRLVKNQEKNQKIMNPYVVNDTKSTILSNIETIHIYLAEKRKIQVGDKMAGRHGNKGIVSQILPMMDMPYLPDGTPLDMVLNPLGVPSRMNVGQLYECLLGLAGKFLGENYKVFPFDEIYGPDASRSFVFNKLYQARSQTGFNWLFDPNSPGKMRLYDGRTGDSFDQKVTVGQAYILRLVHMVDDKIHMRSTGPYSLVTQQPLRGRSKQGGQRLGEMEVWAIEGYGAAFTLLEMLTIKSDDMTGRMTLWSNLILNKDISIGTPESFKVLICELQALCLDIGLFRYKDTKIKTPYSLREISSLVNLK